MTVDRVEVLQTIKEAVPDIDLSGIGFDTSLTEAGLDSLDMANALLAVQEKYNVRLEDQAADELNTIDEIVSYLSK